MKKSASIRKKKIYNKLTSVLYVILSILLGLYFIIIAVRDWQTLQNWNNQSSNEYNGTYEIIKSKYWRNTNYRFVLHNGDVVEVPGEYILLKEQLLSSYQTDEIIFRYQTYRHPFRNTYEAISITSTKDGSTFVDSEFMENKLQSTVGIYAFLGLCTLLPILLRGGLYLVESMGNSKSSKL